MRGSGLQTRSQLCNFLSSSLIVVTEEGKLGDEYNIETRGKDIHYIQLPIPHHLNPHIIPPEIH